MIEPDSNINKALDSVEKGQKVLIDDRTIPLEVVDRLEKQITKLHRRHRGTRDYYDIVVLEGNGTKYHLLWHHGSGHNPILRKRSEWEEIEKENGEVEYNYSRGARIESLEIVENDS